MLSPERVVSRPADYLKMHARSRRLAQLGLATRRWNDCHRAELTEMLVKSKRSWNLESLHDDEARAVRKAPSLILMTLINLPGLPYVLFRDPFDFENVLA